MFAVVVVVVVFGSGSDGGGGGGGGEGRGGKMRRLREVEEWMKGEGNEVEKRWVTRGNEREEWRRRWRDAVMRKEMGWKGGREGGKEEIMREEMRWRMREGGGKGVGGRK